MQDFVQYTPLKVKSIDQLLINFSSDVREKNGSTMKQYTSY
jgi:hypothetical protein